MTRSPVRRALLSTHDKSGLVPFGSRLAASSVELIASGGTAAALARQGLEVTPVEAITGSQEMLGGRVKTLHPAIAAGILADRSDPGHLAELEAAGIAPIDLVVVDLYPFQAAAGRPERELVDLVDIGGVTLLRAAAKNHAWVGAVSSREQYDEVAAAVEAGGLPEELRLDLAREAFFRTAAFDAEVLVWLEGREERTPERAVLPLRRVRRLRYGENPHQEASLYRLQGSTPWWMGTRQLQGKEPSFNNLLDAEAAWRHATAHEAPTSVIVKHTNPCGVASRNEIAEAFESAWDCDPLSAYGGVVALNRLIDVDTAAFVVERFIEVIVAPRIAPQAAGVLARRSNLRVLEALPPLPEHLDFRGILGGFLVQEPDVIEPAEWKVVSRREPTAAEVVDLRFGWVVVAFAASNAVVIASRRAAVGIGAGDPSRIGAAERALQRAGDRSRGAVAASDGFLPFRDTVDALSAAGVTALIEPGGSIRDREVIEAADANDMALLFTGRRHFRH